MDEAGEAAAPEPAADARPSAEIHYIYDWFAPPLQAVISNARRLQEYLLEVGALSGRELPFPELAPDWYGVASDI